jgi:Putative transposase, YhgA-like
MAKAKRIPAHDSLVRNVFSRRKAVAILLRRVLHPDLLPYVDFHSLRPGPTAHTDDELDTRHTDLCFTVDLVYGGRRYPLHPTIEHQSTPAPRMPWRAHVYVGDHWRRYIKDHPGPPYTLPFVLPILLVQHPARNTPYRLTSILAMPPKLRRLLGTPVELALVVDDFSGSVLDDHAADPATRALVELARAFLHAYENPGSLTQARMATLATQLDILLARNSPDPDSKSCGKEDVRALCKYVIEVFEEGSPLRAMLRKAISQPVREVYMTIEEALLAKGEKRGIAKGEKRGIAKGEKRGIAKGEKRGIAKGEKKGLAKGEKRGLAKGEKRGIAKGRASAVLELLELRELPIPAPVRKRLLATHDEPLLRRWLARALSVPSAEALFEPLEA